MASSVCFLHHSALPTAYVLHAHRCHRQVPSQLKPSKLVLVKAQKQDAQDHDQSGKLDAIVSRRSAISVLVGSAALASQRSPADAALNGAPERIMPARVIKVVAINGSLERASENHGLLRAAKEICDKEIKDMQIEIVEVGDLPLLNPDIKPFPPSVDAFLGQVRAADCFLFATAEYNYSVTGALKNAIDWASMDHTVFKGKPAAVMSAAYELGGGLAQFSLRQMAVRLDMRLINDPQLFVFILKPPNKFDKDGNLIDAGIREQVKELLLSLRASTLRPHFPWILPLPLPLE